jgi:hypothetical protein
MRRSDTSERRVERPGKTDSTPPARTVVYIDADGAVVTDPARAVHGEIIEDDNTGNRHSRTWFRIEEVELDWLPVREFAFLLWVLAFLVAVWLIIGVLLYFV